MHPIEEREAEFAAGYEDFEADDLIKLVIATGEWLERLLFATEPVNEAMSALYLSTMGRDSTRKGVPWRELWAEPDDVFSLPSAQYLVALNRFAFYGLRPSDAVLGSGLGDEADPQELAMALGAGIAKGRSLLDSIPAGWAEAEAMRSTVLAAEARFNLDLGEDISPDQLAALARVSIKSVRNLLTPKAGQNLSLTAQGRVRAADALRWLSKRPDFKPSLWQKQADESLSTPSVGQAELGEVIFVPVARDGTWFDPVTCRRGAGYTIGQKGAEEVVKDFRAALDRLARMPTPNWRRPNESGNWGIVSGVAWRRIPVAELQSAEPQ